MSKIIRGLSEDGGIICYAMDSTDIVAEAMRTHQSSGVVTAALGRLLTAASLMGSQMKFEKESLTLRVKGDGPMGAIIAVSDYQGNVRGYPENPTVELPLNKDSKLDVAGAVGENGQLSVMQDFGSGDPYIGHIELVTGEIAEDITAYYAYSEQIPTACALGVMVNKDHTRVLNAGGFIAQVLPDALDGSISRLEENIKNMKPVTIMLFEGRSIEDVLGAIMEGLNPKIIDERQVEYRCNCSRERSEKALISLGIEELTTLMNEDEVTEIDCHFCSKKYRFSRADIKRLIDSL